MYRYLLLLFFLVPLLEVWLLVRVGAHIGPWLVILSIFATAVIGAFFLRLQGFSTLHRAQGAMLSGRLPAVEMVEGVLLLLAGALLLTPGYATDVVGFLLLWPASRTPLARYLLARVLIVDPLAGAEKSAHDAYSASRPGQQQAGGSSATGAAPHRHPHQPEVLEGEFTRED
ncbi:MAG: FxsA family protein [Gammaproteobacteria bacterium]|nr:FxsA family protein [Gammaproteobacteria bacterium]MBT8152098.1 FxsA family protein [Gammaproteobacteria bacterium]NND40247.1 FxsA family protein [Pseudomonadales bacterium]NNL11978.1 FxsA family protein [Pseudomonadales bacterium]NNM10846.1 FxsA family protein [Pseudomonadales bacterium]